MGFAVPGWAGLSFAVLEELRGPTGAHTQALVCCLPGLLVETDHHSLLHTWDKTHTAPQLSQVMTKEPCAMIQGSFINVYSVNIHMVAVPLLRMTGKNANTHCSC